MAAQINIPAYSDALVVLATAGVVVPLVRRWGISPVLGYLGAVGTVLLVPHEERLRGIPFVMYMPCAGGRFDFNYACERCEH